MVVQHNLIAMNSNRMLGITSKSQAKSTEKLSSGYKINRAADDAAGLSISEKMRKQIRGLTQASANAQDGISAVQTAEGALTEVHDMLQRMNELAVKAANGTNAENDRSYIQNEIDQLITEIDRVSTTTKFNETYLLKGVNTNGEVAKLTFDTAKNTIGSKIAGAALTFDDDGLATASINTVASTSTTATAQVSTMCTAQTTQTNTLTKDGNTFTLSNTITSCTGSAQTTATYTINKSAEETVAINGVNYKLYNGMAEEDLKMLGLNINDSTQKTFTNKSDLLNALDAALNEAGLKTDVKDMNWDSAAAQLKVTAFADLNNALDISLHVGADSTKDNKIGVGIEMLGARGLGINGLKVDGDTADNATAAIDVIEAAIQKVSTQRSELGAVQNRLEHTITNLDNVVENTTSAESAIRDTDMATEMVKYSNNNILAQAGQAMLAQANQSNQGVLSLLG